MAVTNLNVTRIGGNPPTHFRVEGDVLGCETLHVSSTCTKGIPVQVSIPTGANNHWGPIDLPNDSRCTCGDSVTVTAYCGLGTPSVTNLTSTLPVCDPVCPTLTITADPPGPCVNGKRSVTFRASVNGVPTMGAALLWTFPNGVPAFSPVPAVSNGPLPNQIVEYAANTLVSVTRTAILQIILPANCPPTSVTVTIDSCPSCCPQVRINRPQVVNNQAQPEVTGCAPGSAVATFDAALTWPTGCTPVTPSSYEWTLNGPGGKKYQRSTSQPKADTNTPWTDVASGNPAAVQFTAGGNYSVSVTAAIPGVSLPCNPTDAAPFTVLHCCPTFTGQLNAQQDPNNPCRWEFSAQVDNPNSLTLQFDWLFEKDTKTDKTSNPFSSNLYPPGFIPPDTVRVTMSVPGNPACGPIIRSTMITPSCPSCPTVGTPSAVVTGCVPAPGTAPGTPPAVVLSTSVSPPVATSFDWTVTTPGGTSFTKTTTAASTTDGTADGAWTDTSTGSTGVLNLGASGGYAVTVRAKGPNISPTCLQPPAISFTFLICPCLPGMTPNAMGVCVPIPPICPPGMTPNASGVCVLPPDRGMNVGCWVLLIAAIVLGVLASILGIVAVCSVPINIPLAIAAVIVGVVALMLFILWLIFCATGNCFIFNIVRWIVMYIIAAAIPVGIILGIVTWNLVCGFGAFAILAGYWGVILVILDTAGPRIGCPLLSPPPF